MRVLQNKYYFHYRYAANAFGTRSKTRSEHLPERVRNTFENAFGTRSWMRSETRVISLWSFEFLRKIPNTINENTVTQIRLAGIIRPIQTPKKYRYTDVKYNASFDWHNDAFHFIKFNITFTSVFIRISSRISITALQTASL